MTGLIKKLRLASRNCKYPVRITSSTSTFLLFTSRFGLPSVPCRPCLHVASTIHFSLLGKENTKIHTDYNSPSIETNSEVKINSFDSRSTTDLSRQQQKQQQQLVVEEIPWLTTLLPIRRHNRHGKVGRSQRKMTKIDGGGNRQFVSLLRSHSISLLT